MTLAEILKYVGNTGLALFLVIWGVWRADKFLSSLCHHIKIINGELGDVSRSLKDVCEHIKKKSTD